MNQKHWHRRDFIARVEHLIRACRRSACCGRIGRHTLSAAEQRDEFAALHHEKFPIRRLHEHPARWDRKLACSAVVAQAAIMASSHGPDVCN